MNKPFRNQSSLSRRHFLAASALIPTLMAVPGATVSRLDAAASSAATPAKKTKIGLELYSVRGEMGKDLPRTLNEVGKMGYEVVEFYSPYFGWKPSYAKDVRA